MLPVPADGGSVDPVAILATISGFTVIGSALDGPSPTMAWVSTDGLTWRTVPVPAEMAGFQAAGGGLLRGQVLALGNAGEPPYHAATWRLVNGSSWVAGPLLAGQDAGAEELVSGPRGFLIVGTRHPRVNTESPPGTVLWFSADGTRFSPTPIRFDNPYSSGSSARGYFLSGFSRGVGTRDKSFGPQTGSTGGLCRWARTRRTSRLHATVASYSHSTSRAAYGRHGMASLGAAAELSMFTRPVVDADSSADSTR